MTPYQLGTWTDNERMQGSIRNHRNTWLAGASHVARRFKPRSRFHGALLLTAATVWLVAGVCAFDQYTRVGPITDRHRDALAAELAAVPVPPGVPPGTQTADSKPGQALITESFVSSPGLPVLRAFYDPFLGGAGWHFARELQRGVYRMACYQRNDEVASITEDTGARSYSLWFSFGFGLDICR